MTFESDPLLITIAETERRLSLGKTTVRRLIDERRIETVRIGRAVRVKAASVADFARQQTESPDA
jgi:excisionase family DNA binding protein